MTRAYYADILCERGRCYLQKYITAPENRGKSFEANRSPWTRDVHPKYVAHIRFT